MDDEDGVFSTCRDINEQMSSFKTKKCSPLKRNSDETACAVVGRYSTGPASHMQVFMVPGFSLVRRCQSSLVPSSHAETETALQQPYIPRVSYSGLVNMAGSEHLANQGSILGPRQWRIQWRSEGPAGPARGAEGARQGPARKK